MYIRLADVGRIFVNCFNGVFCKLDAISGVAAVGSRQLSPINFSLLGNFFCYKIKFFHNYKIWD